jgi:hypothetical protein
LLFFDAKEKSIAYFNETNDRHVSRTFEMTGDKKEKFFTLVQKFNNGEKTLLFASATPCPNGKYSVQLRLYPKGMSK